MNKKKKKNIYTHSLRNLELEAKISLFTRPRIIQLLMHNVYYLFMLENEFYVEYKLAFFVRTFSISILLLIMHHLMLRNNMRSKALLLLQYIQFRLDLIKNYKESEKKKQLITIICSSLSL